MVNNNYAGWSGPIRPGPRPILPGPRPILPGPTIKVTLFIDLLKG